MGIISNIIDLMRSAKDGKSTFDSSNFAFKTTRNSLSRKSSNSILQFPVICSGALSMDDLMLVTKTLEREYCQFVRIAASLDDVIKTNQTKMDKIRSLHQNIGYHGQRTVGLRNGIPFMESTDLSYTSICEAFEKKNIELLKIVNEDLNPTILNDMTNKNNRNYYRLNEADDDPEYLKARKDRLNQQMQYDREARDRNIEMHELQVNKYERDAKRFEKDVAIRDAEEDRREREFGIKRSIMVNQNTAFKDQLLSTDVRNANELVPSMMDLQFVYESEYGQFMTTNVIIGVKAVAHLVTSEEMVTNVATAVKEKRHFFKFLQWTTGEIEMVKDWILAKDKIKDEVKRQRSGKESVWWRRLKGRSAEDKLRRFTFNKKDVLPNSTLVMTMDEVEMIANTYNINILKDRRAINALFDTFFLLGLVIVDSATEVAYFRFDGEEDWQTQSYRSLEKESNNAADMRSMVSLMNNQNFR